MSDTMRDAFVSDENLRLGVARLKQFCSLRSPPYELPADSFLFDAVRDIWKMAAQSQPAPPVPSSVQEIVRLMGPYISACVDAGVNNVTGRTSIQFEADVAKVEATFKPLYAALTALIKENHRLKFELAGVNARCKPLADIDCLMALEYTVLNDYRFTVAQRVALVRAVEKAHGIEPEQGESHE